MDKILLVNKDKGCTSRDVVNELAKKFNTKKIGHFGTLDPLATGLLVIGIGKYTKIGNLFSLDNKSYIAEVKVGVCTDSYDIEGNIIKEEEVISIDEEELIDTLNSFKGKYMQEVPIYSAVKVNGKKLYEYARSGEEVILPKKEVEIFDIELLEVYFKENHWYFTFKCDVSKGTYIRSLINDISKKMNIFMCMNNLKRIKQDKFLLEDSYTINDILNDNYKFLELSDVLDISVLEIPSSLEKKIVNGSLIDYKSNKPILFIKDGQNVALYIKYNKDNSKMKPFIIY